MIEPRTSSTDDRRRRAGRSQLTVPRRFAAITAAVGLLVVALAAPVAAADSRAAEPRHENEGNEFRQHNLFSDVPGRAAMTDPYLVNAWGMSFGPSTPLWVSDNGSDLTTLYKGSPMPNNLQAVPLVVSIPNGEPTGQVYNPSSDWVVTSGTDSGPSLFIFASESGTISGWSPGVPGPAPSTSAQVGVTVPNAVYKGLAITTGSGGDWLFAANFHAGTIDVFDGNWHRVHWPGAFRDPMIPAHYAPFNIQDIGGRLYVTYARQDAQRHDDVKGPGHGFIDVYDVHGNLLRRLVSRGSLNSPWGLALAPAGFGRFGGDLLVGNFGDGRINAFDPVTGHFAGRLRRENGSFIHIDGLWGLMFGNGVAATPKTLIFSAGPGGESHGLLGTLTVAP